MDEPWDVELLGSLCARQGARTVTRFRTQKAAALFAFLAYHLHSAHAREQLATMFWPDDAPEDGRNSLRVTLSSLRKQFEPPGVPVGTVVAADRMNVRLSPVAFVTDVGRFEAALRSTERAGDDAERMPLLMRAAEVYGGDLLPGVDGDWIGAERERLAEAYQGALHRLVTHLSEQGDFGRALDYGQRAIRVDPLREKAHRSLMRLHAAAGNPAAAREQYQELQRLLRRHLDAEPSAATQRLAEQLFGSADPTAVKASKKDTKNPPLDADRRQDDNEGGAVPAQRVPLRGRLPLLFDRFFGRDVELQWLKAQLRPGGTRLVTLTGTGGMGKTRLAVETGARLRDDFAGAVWFVPLADVAEPSLIMDAVFDALSLVRSAGVDAAEQVAAELSRQPSLLILDNMEHLAAGGGSVVQSLRERVPALAVLVTSRRRLSLPGEAERPLAPLPTSGPVDLEGMSRVVGVALFIDRAQAARPDFQLTKGNREAVAALCARLDGVPLALELAAARASVLTPAQMLAQLSRRFELLVARRGTGRMHDSLRATLEWSFGLLSPPLQRFFARLSAFRGGWTAEAAQAVCEEPAALDFLAQLRSHSLVITADGGQCMRFGLLETLREFAQERLAPGERRGLAQRHALFYSNLAEEARPHLTGSLQAHWIGVLHADQENLRQALDWAQTQDPPLALRTASALSQFWYVGGHLTEGRKRLTAVLPWAEGADTAVAARAVGGAGLLAYSQGDYAASQPLLERCLALWRALDDTEGIGQALNYLGNVAILQGRVPEARRLFEESLRLRRMSGDTAAVAATLGNLGNVAYSEGDFAAAERFYAECLQLYRTLEKQANTAFVLYNLALVSHTMGELGKARALYQESLDLQRDLGDRWGAAYSLGGLGYLCVREGDLAAARAHLDESIAVVRELDDRPGIANVLAVIGSLELAQGDYSVARLCYAESLRLARELGNDRELANLLGHFARLAAAEKRPARAASLWGAAEARRAESLSPISPVDLPAYERDLASARAALADDLWQTAWDEGRAMPVEEAVRYALEETDKK